MSVSCTTFSKTIAFFNGWIICLQCDAGKKSLDNSKQSTEVKLGNHLGIIITGKTVGGTHYNLNYETSKQATTAAVMY